MRVVLALLSGLIAGVAMADSSFAPERHFPMADPAAVDPGSAERAYAAVVDDMAARFASSGDPAAVAYRGWWRANRSPYISATHGARYVNNYVNRPALVYGSLAPGEAMPVGSIIAKDAISIDAGGRVLPGPLALMEKMPAGFAPEAGDWRYALIMPDGSIFADSNGSNPGGTAFCVACHATRASVADHLFHLPPAVARAPIHGTPAD